MMMLTGLMVSEASPFLLETEMAFEVDGISSHGVQLPHVMPAQSQRQ